MNAKRFLSFALVIVMLFGSIGAYASEIAEFALDYLKDANETDVYTASEELDGEKTETSSSNNGTTELGIKWTLSEGMLTLSGEGEMDNFFESDAPWKEYQEEIKFIYISEGITGIGEYAFSDLSNVNSVYIPETVVKIGRSAFENCSMLEEIQLPESLEEIGNSAFSYCLALTSVTIPDKVESFNNSAFQGCSSLAEILVNDTNSNFTSNEGVLFNYDGTVLISYPDGKEASEYYVPEGVITIGEKAFDTCEALTNIVLPESLETIESGAFYECSNIGDITIPASVKSIAQDAILYGMDSLRAINVDENNEVYSSENGILYNKDKTRLIRVPAQCEFVYGECILSKTLTVIGQEAFYGCQTAELLWIHGTLQKIEMAAFLNCSSVTEIWFDGTEFNWNLVDKGILNDALNEIPVLFANSEIKEEVYNLTAGRTYYLKDYVNTEEYKDVLDTLVVSSSNPDVALVDTTKLIAVAPGEALITAIGVKDGVTGAISVTVNVLESGEDDKTGSFYLTVGETRSLVTELVIPLEYREGLNWATGNRNIATVENGVITAVGPGETNVVASLVSGSGKEFSVRCKIVVEPKYTDEKYFEMSKGTITKYNGPDSNVVIPKKIGGVEVTAIGDSAFADCSHVTKVEMPTTVTTIGLRAFSNCSMLSDIKLHKGITNIGNYAFSNCSSLVKMVIPSTLTNHPTNVFSGCKKLTTIEFESGTTTVRTIAKNLTYLKKVVLPGTVKTIKDSAFYNCTSLETVNIPDSVTKIGYEAFRNCYKLKTVKLGKGVETLGSYAFYNCTGLTSISFNSPLKVINEYTFYKCSSLEKIILPDALIKIGQYAFGHCLKLSSVTMKNNVTTLGDACFIQCGRLTSINLSTKLTAIPMNAFYYSGLTTIVIPDSVTSIGDSAFSNSAKLTNVIFGSGIKSIDYAAFSHTAIKNVVIPDSVIYLGSYVFASCKNLAEVTIGNGVRSLATNLFRDCSSLTEVVLGDNIQRIGQNAFYNSGLVKIVIPDSVTSIGSQVFRGCTKLKDVTIGAGIKNVTPNLFYGCSSIQTVRLAYGIETIDGYAFSSCSTLNSIEIPNTVTKIGDYAFRYCTALTEIVIPDSVTKLGEGVFENCTKLESVILSDNITTIERYTFYSCRNLNNVELPDKLVTIGSNSFVNCTKLESITIPENVISINTYAFGNCKKLSNVRFNSKLQTIGYQAFMYCESLNNLTLPENLRTIDDHAFSYCTSLTKLDVPESVRNIYSYAFSYCTSLREIKFADTNIYFGSNVFLGCSDLAFSGGIPTALIRYIVENNLFANGELNIKHKYLNPANTNYRSVNDVKLGYIPMELTYEFKRDVNAKDKIISIYLPSTATIMDNTLKIDGISAECNFVPSGQKLNRYTIPVKNDSGTITFCIKPTVYTNIATYAEIGMKILSSSKSELIGYSNCSLPEISIDAPDEVGSSAFTVSGLALPNSIVNLYIDGKWEDAFQVGSSGSFTRKLTLDELIDYKTYTIKASAQQNGNEYTAEAVVLYTSESPELIGLTMVYDKGEWYRTRRDYELFDIKNKSPKVQWGDYWTGNNYIKGTSKAYNYSYLVYLDNTQVLDKVYVVSTRNNIKQYLEAVKSPDGNYYETKGFFADDNQYIPGTITVEYTKKVRNDVHPLSYNKKLFNIDDAPFKSTISEYTSNSYNATVDVTESYRDIFGEKIKVDYMLVDKEYSDEEYNNLKTSDTDYYAYEFENGLLSFDLREEGNAVIEIHNKADSKNQAYKVNFYDVEEDGTEVYRDVEGVIAAANSKFTKVLNAYNLNIDTEKLYKDMRKVFKTEEAINQATNKIEAIKVKKNMLMLALASITASSYDNLSASDDIIMSILKTAEEDVTYFRNYNLVNLYQVGDTYKVNWKIDPSGFAYEGVTDNRLGDVTASIYYVPVEDIPLDENEEYDLSALKDGDGTLWDKAEEYEQENTILTDENGDYRWDVPEGAWQVKFEKAGYETAYSKWMTVPPIQTGVNVGLVSKAKPTVERVHLTTKYLTVTFDKYMDPASMIDAVNVADMPYTLEYDTEKVDMDGNNFAKEFTVKFKEELNTGTPYAITIEGAKSYAGVEMEKYQNASEKTDGEALPAELIIENIAEKSGVVTVYYNNNTGKTINFTIMCVAYDKDGKVCDVNVDNVYDLITGRKTQREFTLDGNWKTYKVFTWSEEDNLHPIIDSVEKGK